MIPWSSRSELRSAHGEKRAFGSPNGDWWFLVRDLAEHVFIRHEANRPSGGKVTDIEIGAFLSEA
jgi:hypothetical protein